MGIKGLKQFLAKKDPNLIKLVHLSKYAGKRAAVDISGYIYKYKISDPGKWLDSIIYLTRIFRINDICPVFVFDGKPPPEKTDEMAKRKATKDKQKERVWALEEAIDVYHSAGTISPVLIEEMADYKVAAPVAAMLQVLPSGDSPAGRKKELPVNIHYLEAKLKKLEKNIPKINPEDVEAIKKWLTICGLPYVQAPGEAEVYCAYLYKTRHVSVVFSNDTDNLTHGVGHLVYSLHPFTGSCEEMILAEVLQALELDFPAFVDFCIMCGTDYNENVQGVGPVSAYKYIKRLRSIDKVIEEVKFSLLDLKHIRSRELFQFGDDPELGKIPLPLTKPIDFSAVQEFLFQKNCRVKLETIKEAWRPVEIVITPKVPKGADEEKREDTPIAVAPGPTPAVSK